jgi:hypothetical protein
MKKIITPLKGMFPLFFFLQPSEARAESPQGAIGETTVYFKKKSENHG